MRLDHLLSKENGRKEITSIRIGVRKSECCSILSELDKKLLIKKEKRWGHHGGVAQLGEHLPCKQGVMGSNPIISIKKAERPAKVLI